MKIIKVPALNGLGKTNGCEKAPNKIIKTIEEFWTNESGKEINIKNFSIKEFVVDNSNIKASNQNIFNKAKKILEKNKNKKVVFLGGDHSISHPLVRAFRENHKNCGLIVFDAHADCMPFSKEPSHEEWLRALIENGFNAENVFLIGSRNNDPGENEFLKKKKVNLFSVNEFLENLEESCNMLMEKVKSFDSLYVSIDIDAVDPAFAPGTGYIEPAGLTSRQLIYLIQKLNLLNNIKAVDVVEINPDKDVNEMTAKLGAKIIVEMI